MTNKDNAGTYFGQEHPLIKHDRDCSLCAFGKRSENVSVGGAGPNDLNQVRLIIISDHPGYYEVLKGFPLYNNEIDRMPNRHKRGFRKTLPEWRNSGNYLRYMLRELYALDTYENCWVTNACKCDRRNDTIVESTVLKPCVFQWLQKELEILDQYVPEVPILTAGATAYLALKLLDKEFKRHAPTALNDARREPNFFFRSHPLVVTINPASISKLTFRVIQEVGAQVPGRIPQVKRANFWMPYLPGMPETIFRDDLLMLKPYLNAEHSRPEDNPAN